MAKGPRGLPGLKGNQGDKVRFFTKLYFVFNDIVNFRASKDLRVSSKLSTILMNSWSF